MLLLIVLPTVGMSQFVDTLRVSSNRTDMDCLLENVVNTAKIRLGVAECGFEMQMGGVDYLLETLSTDLGTKAFDQIDVIYSVRMCLNKNPLSCIQVQEWYFKDNEQAHCAKQQLLRVSTTTIHYKPPQNWLWLLNGSRIIFVYSETFPITSNSFMNTVELVKNVYGI